MTNAMILILTLPIYRVFVFVFGFVLDDDVHRATSYGVYISQLIGSVCKSI